MKRGLFDTFKNDSREAAFRIASAQAMKFVKREILSKIRARGISQESIAKISRWLDSEAGSIALSIVAGFVSSYIPPFKHNSLAKYLAPELNSGLSALTIKVSHNKALGQIVKQYNKLFKYF